MTTKTGPTITRAQLQEVCERIIRAVPSLTLEDQAALRHVAQTARRVAGDSIWWDTKTECGCLVGTLLKGDPITALGDDYPRCAAFNHAGALYLRELFRVTNRSWPWSYRIPVTDP